MTSNSSSLENIGPNTLTDDAVDTNPNTSWMRLKPMWAIYLSLIFTGKVFASAFVFSPEISWTLTNVGHAMLTFLFFHWLKGTPIAAGGWEQGKYDRLTFWEQLDGQRQFTPTRKFLTTIPIILFIWTSINVQTRQLFVLNLVASALILLPKLPLFHRVRIFGINS